MEKERILWLDSIKCFAIILVVIGHIIQFIVFPDNFDLNPIYRFIYSFHMPLFFLLSGYVSDNKEMGGDKIWGKALQLLVPFCVWGFVNRFTFMQSYHPYISIFKHPDYSLWFLWVLFIIYMTNYTSDYIAIEKNRSKSVFRLISCTLLFIIGNYVTASYGLGKVAQYAPFYYIGWLLKTNAKANQLIANRYFILFNIVLYMMASIFFIRDVNSLPESWPSIMMLLNQTYLYKFILAISACVCVVVMFKKYEESFDNVRVKEVGRNTLGIYAIHQTVIWLIVQVMSSDCIEISKSVGGFTILSIIVFLFTWVIMIFFRTNRITKLLFLGEFNKDTFMCLKRK